MGRRESGPTGPAGASTHNGRHLICDGGNTIAVLDTADPVRAAPVARARGFVGDPECSSAHHLAMHPGGRFLVSAHLLDSGESFVPTSSVVIGWDLTDLRHPTRAVMMVDAWDIPGWAPSRRSRPAPLILKGQPEVNALALNPDGALLATAGRDHTLLWDTEHLPRLKVIARLEHSRPVTALAFSPDGGVLAAADGTTVTLWNPDAGNPAPAPGLT